MRPLVRPENFNGTSPAIPEDAFAAQLAHAITCFAQAKVQLEIAVVRLEALLAQVPEQEDRHQQKGVREA
jgi:hypothetical protein